MANEIAGFKGIMRFSTSTGGTQRTVASLRNFNINPTMSPIDVTTHESSGHRNVIAGIRAWTASAETLFVLGTTYHRMVFDILTAGTKTDFEWLPTGSSSDGYWSGSGYFDNWDLASPNEDALAHNLSIVGDGALTRSSSST